MAPGPRFVCDRCDKRVPSRRGFWQHQTQCKAAAKVDLAHEQTHLTSDELWWADQDDDLPEPVAHEAHGGFYNPRSSSAQLELPRSTPQPESEVQSSSKGSSLVQVTYSEAIGVSARAGSVYPPTQGERCINSVSQQPLTQAPQTPIHPIPDDWYYPFTNEADYDIAQYLIETHATASNVTKLFKRPGLSKALSHTSGKLRSFHDWRNMVERVPYGIEDDDWNRVDCHLSARQDGAVPSFSIWSRSVLACVRFLIGHPPFAQDMAYEPVRVYKDTERTQRVYNEMHTADKWWDTQARLPAGATLIPLILASDKFQYTQFRGDKCGYPVYLTIGNIAKSVRRAQKRPSKVLLALIPIPSGDLHRKIRVELYHTALQHILRPIEKAAVLGVPMRCADGKVRHCYPIIGGFCADYPEQVLITGVKSGRHCPICQVHPDERHDLSHGPSAPRSPEQAQERITGQRSRGKTTKRSDPMDLPDASNFSWRHHLVNIHEVMHVDILHQLSQGLVKRIVQDWVPAMLQDLPQTDNRKKRKLDHGKAIWQVEIDRRFAQVPAFRDIKIFKHFTDVVQWTGNEQKSLVRQIIPVLAPLLPTAAVQFLRALVDFVLHAQYYSHDSDTILWMEQAIKRMDRLKHCFTPYVTSSVGFNFPKMHALVHWPEMIRKFGSADGYDTSQFEAAHKYLLKEWFPQTNRQDDFDTQLLMHNIRAFKMTAMHDLLEWRARISLNARPEEPPVMATRAAKCVDLRKTFPGQPGRRLCSSPLRVLSCLPRTQDVPHLHRGRNYWTRASQLSDLLEIPDFIDALAVFVREERLRLTQVKSSNRGMNLKEHDTQWIRDYAVCLHQSLACFKAGQSDGVDVNPSNKDSVKCAPDWQRRGHWRRDHVWVQEYPDGEALDRLTGRKTQAPLQGKLPGKTLVIISIADPTIQDSKLRPRTYTGVMVDVYELLDRGRHNNAHGMILARRVEYTLTTSRTLGRRRFYHLGQIHRSAHLIPTEQPATFYVNHYADLDQYTTLYDENFLEKDEAIALRLSRELHQSKR